jgi:hypothetical protein
MRHEGEEAYIFATLRSTQSIVPGQAGLVLELLLEVAESIGKAATAENCALPALAHSAPACPRLELAVGTLEKLRRSQFMLPCQKVDIGIARTCTR